MLRKILTIIFLGSMLGVWSPPCGLQSSALAETAGDYSLVPPFVTAGVPPLVMLVLGRDHKLYYEAYNDASDLDGDGSLDITYKPSIDYYGYFDSYKCYEYDAVDNRFEPTATTADKTCSGMSEWSGDFLNYLTMTRLDCLRKVLYGGYRSVDTATETVLRRASIPQDGHSWGKEYESIARDGYDISLYTPYSVPGAGRRHLFASTTLTQAGPPLLRVLQSSPYRIWQWVSKERDSAGVANTQIQVSDNNYVNVTPTDFQVNIQVGLAAMPESNCKQYPSGVYKPIGLLQRHGESERMYFGLMTGSYAHNTKGGVLRKNIGSITDEINASTGEFRYLDVGGVGGIIKTIDNFRVLGFDYPSRQYDCWFYNHAMNDGECRMWGNPIAEIMYETMRYFAGETATTDFTSGIANGNDSTVDLPLPAWQDPYSTNSDCAKPFMLVISDINPNFDTDQLPGVSSDFNSTFSGSLTSGGSNEALDVGNLASTISTEELVSGLHYIGQSGTFFDTACSAKNVAGLGDIRGLCPEEPTKQGGYYASSVSYFGRKEDISAANGEQNVISYTVGLASPLPRIEIRAGALADQLITLVPFAKSVESGTGPVTPARGTYQPTCAIVDFYVESITPTSGRFRVNFEHSEQGADHDMDAIVQYDYQVLANGSVDIRTQTLNFNGGSTKQHLGYIISGTTADGVYLEVRSINYAANLDPNYYLDTPPGITPNTGPADMRWDDRDVNNNRIPLPTDTTRNFTASSNPAATLLRNPLWYAAKWGGYEERTGNANDIPDQASEWDKDADGNPDNYFYVTNPLRLEQQLNRSFADILRRTASGTAASVISSSRSGEGAVYQAIFYTEFKDQTGREMNWAGEVHALLVDAYGNMREDTNGNHQLDLADDLFIEFSADSIGTIYKYSDNPLSGKLGVLDDAERAVPTAVGTMKDVKYLWSANEWLNEIANADITSQRTYSGATNERHIFTFVDDDNDMIADGGEVIDFTASQVDRISPYLHPYQPFNPPGYIAPYTGNASVFQDFITNQSTRIINFIRGQEQAQYTSSTSPSYTIPAFRSRLVDYDEDGVVETWRLGDVVYSTPTIVAAPAEDFDLLYRDVSYIDFYRKYRNRRTVVYAGGNDGMLHAFNGGFYEPGQHKFWKAYTANPPPGDPKYTDTGLGLGAELWAYVPYNLLPHLYWLTEASYNETVHVSYVDLKPRIFDAKIFNPDATHPNGWGTVLVGGMRFGGGKIRADIDKNNVFDAQDRTMTSAYFILDITDPESAPTLLAEISSDTLGFTTCYPTVIAVKDKVTANDNNNWYLIFGSGPIGAGGADTGALTEASSSQPAKIFAVNLKELALNHQVWSLDNTHLPAQGVQEFASLDTDSFVSDPITVDFDLDWKADAVYFGTVSGSFAAGSWGGKLRRIVIDDDESPANWDGDSTLIDLTSIPAYDNLGNFLYNYGQPIVAAPTAALDKDGQRWVFFGSGRFFNRQDAIHATASHPRSYYGIKEPRDGPPSNAFNWNEVDRTDLLDVTDAMIFEGGNTVEGVTGVANFSELRNSVGSEDGWLLDFNTTKERNLGQATLLGDILTFTTYIPSVDPCEFEGVSNLYALVYDTGTAYTESIIGLGSNTRQENGVDKHDVLKQVSLGKGLTITPNIHTGREEGSKVYVQTSTGTILEVREQNPGMVKSGKTCWKEWED